MTTDNARIQSALALREAGNTYKQIGLELGISLERARQMVCQAERQRREQETPWGHLSIRARNGIQFALDRKGPFTPEEVSDGLTARELSFAPNLGRVSIDEIEMWLSEHGLSFKAEPEKPKAPPAPATFCPHCNGTLDAEAISNDLTRFRREWNAERKRARDEAYRREEEVKAERQEALIRDRDLNAQAADIEDGFSIVSVALANGGPERVGALLFARPYRHIIGTTVANMRKIDPESGSLSATYVGVIDSGVYFLEPDQAAAFAATFPGVEWAEIYLRRARDAQG